MDAELRKKFEEWHKAEYPMVSLHRDFESGKYRDVYAGERWLGWQAAQPTIESMEQAARKIAQKCWDNEEEAFKEVLEILKEK